MPKSSKGPPGTVEELCKRLAPYFKELDAWLKRRQAEIDKLKEQHPNQHLTPDPPPKPPVLE